MYNVAPPPFYCCCCKDDIILDKIQALKLGELESQFAPTLITCKVIQATYIVVNLQQ